MQPYFAIINISRRVESKLRAKHQISGVDLRIALIYSQNFESAWDPDESEGLKLTVYSTFISGEKFLAVFIPVDFEEGIWDLKTAWRIK